MDKMITALHYQKNRPQRVNVFLDGEFAFSLSKVVTGWLMIGQVINDEKINSLLEEDTREKAYQLSLNYLRYRERSSKELQDFLKRHQIDPRIIQITIERLKHNNLINDERFSETWVENRTTFRPRSRRVMALELKQRGISDEQTNIVLQNVNEEEIIYSLGKKRATRYTIMDWLEFRKKMFSYLSYRGFSYDQITPIIVQLWEENQEGIKNSITSEVTI